MKEIVKEETIEVKEETIEVKEEIPVMEVKDEITEEVYDDEV